MIDCDDRDRSIVTFRRIAQRRKLVCNFCPVVRGVTGVGLQRRQAGMPVLSTDEGRGYGYGPAAEGGKDRIKAPIIRRNSICRR